MSAGERFEIILTSGNRNKEKVNYLNTDWREAIMHFLRRVWGQNSFHGDQTFEKITFGGITITRNVELGMYVATGDDSGMPVLERANLKLPDYEVVVNVEMNAYGNVQEGLAKFVYCMEMRRLTLRWDQNRWIEFSKGRSRGELYVRCGAFGL